LGNHFERVRKYTNFPARGGHEKMPPVEGACAGGEKNIDRRDLYYEDIINFVPEKTRYRHLKTGTRKGRNGEKENKTKASGRKGHG
jgi:hypothetical protein